MKQSLELLLADGVIDEVVGQLKSGKEAEVWLVRRGEEIIAAKVYLERDQRRFRNNAAYKEGRQVRNSRTQRAIDKGSRFGREAEEEAWKAAESDALYKLHGLGVRVPQPVMFYEGVLLMEVVVDPEGYPAPRLADAALGPEAGRPLYEELREQTIRMLCADLIHGDLSPFNVLLAWNGPTIIDFPQVISSAHNNRAEHFFQRDFETIRNFCVALDPSLREHESDAEQIWRAYVRRELTPAFVPQPGMARSRQPKQGHRGDAPGQRRNEFRGGAPGAGGRPSGGRHSSSPSPAPSPSPSHPAPDRRGGGNGGGGGQVPRGNRDGRRDGRSGGGSGGRSMPQVSYRGQTPEPSEVSAGQQPPSAPGAPSTSPSAASTSPASGENRAGQGAAPRGGGRPPQHAQQRHPSSPRHGQPGREPRGPRGNHEPRAGGQPGHRADGRGPRGSNAGGGEPSSGRPPHDGSRPPRRGGPPGMSGGGPHAGSGGTGSNGAGAGRRHEGRRRRRPR